jgi:hypothetical protein
MRKTKLKAFLVGVAAFVLVFFGCSTTSAFVGPISDKPTISVTQLRHVMHTNDYWQQMYVETLSTLSVTNPSTHDMVVTVDCTESRHTLTVKARTTEHVLLDPQDASCSLE